MIEGVLFTGHRETDRRNVARLAVQVLRLIRDCLGRDLFSAAAWDMLMDLYIRQAEPPMSLTSLAAATSSPERTALFTIARLVDRELLARRADQDDGRRIHVDLTPEAVVMLDRLSDALIVLIAGFRPAA